MTAPLLTLPNVATALPGGGQAAPDAGAAGGFDALMAAFFATMDGGAAEAGAGEAKDTDEDIKIEATADETTSSGPIDAQTMAALLVMTPQPAPVVATTPKTEVATTDAGSAPAPAFAPLMAQEMATAPQAPTAATQAEPETAQAPVDAPEDAGTSLLAALTGEDSTTGDAPKTQLTDSADQAKPTVGGEIAQPKTAAAPTPAQAPQAPAQPQVQAQAAAPVAESAADPLVQAQAVASEAEAAVEPVQDHAPARTTKSDAGKRSSATATTTTQTTAQAPADADTNVAVPVVAASADAAGESAATVETDSAAPAKTRETKTETADTPDTTAPSLAPAMSQAGPVASAGQPVRSTPETVAHLTAQILKKSDGKSSHFDVELNPAGLGQVKVAIEIGAHGKMTASLSFENPQAAAELRGRSSELQKALEQAGFDLSGGGLSFDVAGDRGQGRSDQQQQFQQQAENNAWRGRAFQAVLGANDAADAAATAALSIQRRSATGVDVRI